VVVGPAAVAHVADLNLHVVVDLGAAFVLSTLRLLLLLIVIEETIDLRLTHAVKAVSDRFLALLMLLNSLLYDFVRVDSYINVIDIKTTKNINITTKCSRARYGNSASKRYITNKS